MRVKHVMTKDPLCCVPSDTAQHAASLMREAGAGAIPVVESQERRKLVGIVTDRDLCMKVVAEGSEPGDTPVADCMTLKVVSCTAADSIQKATELMKENQIRRVTVIDTDGCLTGIVALADVVERGDVRATETDDTLKKVSAPSSSPSKPRAESRRAA
ncbi:MAG TPA: CBS domain-containing protein [Methylomirabilota bacterium]|nr:CBS domain-containing protein [Methylomirabilota bacterium]